MKKNHYSVLSSAIVIFLLLTVSCYNLERDNPTDPDSGNYSYVSPSSVRATDGDYPDKVVISWAPAPDAERYYIYRSETENGVYIEAGNTTELSFTDTATVDRKIYFYRIRNYSEDYRFSGYSNPDSGYSEIPDLNVSATDGKYIDKVVITWSKAAEDVAYLILKSDSYDGSYTEIKSVTGTDYTDKDVERGKLYFYKIKAVVSTYSFRINSPESGYAGLSIPTDITATDGIYPDRISVAWSSVAGADSYDVYRSDSEFGVYTKIGSSVSDSYSDYTVTPGMFYFYRVIAHSLSSNSYSGFSGYDRGICIEENTGSEGIVMKKIPPGSFQMGQAGIAAPLHTVVLTSSFYLSKYEISWDKWKAVKEWAESSGYTFANNDARGNDGDGASGTDLEPVTSINWYDAVKWCNALSEKEGRTPCYYTDSGKGTVYRSGEINITSDCVNWNANGYRLPTEAEWEYAVRSGASTVYYWGDGNSFSDIDPYAWYSNNSSGNTHPVDSKMPNNFGLYGMAGNVFEWCWDREADYSSNGQTDPKGPDSGSYRILRGGSFTSNENEISSSIRGSSMPSVSMNYFGFRICSTAE